MSAGGSADGAAAGAVNSMHLLVLGLVGRFSYCRYWCCFSCCMGSRCYP
ncbi:hypothetical protein [uncultured Methanobrevibacter sp.]